MNYKVKTIPSFNKQAKKLAKKYKSLKDDLAILIDELQTNPCKGTPIGNNCFKIRMAISSKNKGKSGGARLVSHVVVKDEIVFLISLYDKSDIASVHEAKINELINQIV